MGHSEDRRGFLKKAAMGSIALASLPTLGGVLAASASAREEDEGADNVRWDIIGLDHAPPDATISAGGVAFASARNPGTLRIKLTGSGTFVAPPGGGPSNAVKGGGTWETSGGSDSGSGSYKVERLASWQFANLQAQTPPFFDDIGDTNERANGNAFLAIKYSDGSRGILGILCHGPGAPDGILEGVVATKGFVTYMDSEGPKTPFTDENRTIFHVGREDEGDED